MAYGLTAPRTLPLGVRLYQDTEAGRVVTTEGWLADSSDVIHAAKVLGITVSFGRAGDYVYLQRTGVMELPGFILHRKLWLGTLGQLVQTPPAVGFSLQIGVATYLDQVVLSFGEPTLLA